MSITVSLRWPIQQCVEKLGTGATGTSEIGQAHVAPLNRFMIMARG